MSTPSDNEIIQSAIKLVNAIGEMTGEVVYFNGAFAVTLAVAEGACIDFGDQCQVDASLIAFGSHTLTMLHVVEPFAFVVAGMSGACFGKLVVVTCSGAFAVLPLSFIFSTAAVQLIVHATIAVR